MLKKNEIYQGIISGYSSDGFGIARENNFVVFVKGALDGELAKYKILKVSKSCAWAKVVSIIKKSNNRIVPDCKYYKTCGGCSLRHMNYEEEIKFKKQKIEDCFLKIYGEKINLDNFICANNTKCKINHYRNKAVFPINSTAQSDINIGLYQARSHNIVNIDECKIQTKQSKIVIGIIREWMIKYKMSAYNEKSKSGLIRYIFLRTNYMGEMLVCLVVAKKVKFVNTLVEMLKKENIALAGFVININNKNCNKILGDSTKVIYGENKIIDIINGLKFNLSVESFFQVNREQAENLYNIALNYADIKSQDTVLDLYCGTGTISLLMAKQAKFVYAIEIVEQAIKNAKQNAKFNNICNVKFICDNVKNTSKHLDNTKIDVICVDPPRKGLDSQSIECILQINPKKIVYVSCNPATLARDLKIFTQNSYKVKRVSAVDMFPRTAHIETVVLLEI